VIRRVLFAAACASILIFAQNAVAFDAPLVPLHLVAKSALQAAFTPWDDVEGMIVEEIAGAQKQVLVQAYLLTSKSIAQSLIAAQRRGVDVRILADAEQQAKVESSMIAILAAAGIPVWLETKYQSAHNKIIVIDAASEHSAVITGSFNFTWAAEHKNAENILIVRRNIPLASQYASNWERHWQDATPYIK
jgi:phosphatidylserine/phosphatidylglycerophosphate/cardiolipin synthase-like enzyme